MTPRSLTEEDAAAYCGCGVDAFDTWIKKGIVPGATPGTQRWDRKAIDVWLDRASGIQSEASGRNPLEDRKASRAKAVGPLLFSPRVCS
jgi:hypothetical protein